MNVELGSGKQQSRCHCLTRKSQYGYKSMQLAPQKTNLFIGKLAVPLLYILCANGLLQLFSCCCDYLNKRFTVCTYPFKTINK